MLALRQYLLTLVVLGVGLTFGLPHLIAIGGVVIAALLDFIVTGRSHELDLYRDRLDRQVPTTHQLSSRVAVRLQIAGAVSSASIPLIARALGTDATVQQFAGMMALLIGGSAASYCGPQIIPGSTNSPQEILERQESMPDVLFIVNLLPRRAARLTGALARIVLGVIFLLPFAALLNGLDTIVLNTPWVLITLGLAVFFQMGFVLLSQGLLSLRWWQTAAEQHSK